MSGPRRVAIDARMIAHSGIGTALRGLLRAWAVKPPPFELVLLGDPKLLAAHVPRALTVEVAEFRRPIYSPASLTLGVPAEGADLLYSPHYPVPLGGSVPIVVGVQDLIHITHPTRPGTAAFMRLWLSRLRERAAFVITPSRHTKVQLQTLHRLPAHRVLTIPWGPGLRTCTTEESPIEGLPPAGSLLAVGIYKAHKNWGFLMRRLAALWGSGALVTPLVIACPSEKGRAELRKLVDATGCNERVHFAPHLTDAQMGGLYRRACALLFPSLVEGFGFPIVEAMAAGVPVVAADLPPMNEVGGDALLAFDPDSPESFDRAVLRAVGDAPAREAAISRGLELASRFRWDSVAQRMENVFKRALEE